MEISQEALAAYHAILSESIVETHRHGLDASPDRILRVVAQAHDGLVSQAENLTVDDEEALGTLVLLFSESVRLAEKS